MKLWQRDLRHAVLSRHWSLSPIPQLSFHSSSSSNHAGLLQLLVEEAECRKVRVPPELAQNGEPNVMVTREESVELVLM
jgi:hypothetical protein